MAIDNPGSEGLNLGASIEQLRYWQQQMEAALVQERQERIAAAEAERDLNNQRLQNLQELMDMRKAYLEKMKQLEEEGITELSDLEQTLHSQRSEEEMETFRKNLAEKEELLQQSQARINKSASEQSDNPPSSKSGKKRGRAAQTPVETIARPRTSGTESTRQAAVTGTGTTGTGRATTGPNGTGVSTNVPPTTAGLEISPNATNLESLTLSQLVDGLNAIDSKISALLDLQTGAPWLSSLIQTLQKTQADRPATTGLPNLTGTLRALTDVLSKIKSTTRQEHDQVRTETATPPTVRRESTEEPTAVTNVSIDSPPVVVNVPETSVSTEVDSNGALLEAIRELAALQQDNSWISELSKYISYPSVPQTPDYSSALAGIHNEVYSLTEKLASIILQTATRSDTTTTKALEQLTPTDYSGVLQTVLGQLTSFVRQPAESTNTPTEPAEATSRRPSGIGTEGGEIYITPESLTGLQPALRELVSPIINNLAGFIAESDDPRKMLESVTSSLEGFITEHSKDPKSPKDSTKTLVKYTGGQKALDSSGKATNTADELSEILAVLLDGVDDIEARFAKLLSESKIAATPSDGGDFTFGINDDTADQISRALVASGKNWEAAMIAHVNNIAKIEQGFILDSRLLQVESTALKWQKEAEHSEAFLKTQEQLIATAVAQEEAAGRVVDEAALENIKKQVNLELKSLDTYTTFQLASIQQVSMQQQRAIEEQQEIRQKLEWETTRSIDDLKRTLAAQQEAREADYMKRFAAEREELIQAEIDATEARNGGRGVSAEELKAIYDRIDAEFQYTEAYKNKQRAKDRKEKEKERRDEEKRKTKEAKEKREGAKRAYSEFKEEGTWAEKKQAIAHYAEERGISTKQAGAEVAMNAAMNALADLAKQLENKVDSLGHYQGVIDTRLQGSSNKQSGGSYWKQLSKDMISVGAVTPFFKQEDFANNIESLVNKGISFNLKQRAFLMTIQEKIANTFEVADGTLLRLIRVQQADTTASRLGMESALNSFLNNMYETSEYLTDVASSVRGSLMEMEALMGAKAATEVEYQVQKWMGSLYSVGMSQEAVTSISNALGQIASGDVNALSGDGAGNLLIMAANEIGLPIADMLAKGIDSKQTNDLLQAVVNYLADLSKATADNRVVQQQLASVYGIKASDMQAAVNLAVSKNNTINAIYQSSKYSNMSYDQMLGQLNNMAGSMINRTSMGEFLTNIWENAQYSAASSMANNPVTYLIYKLAGLLDDAVGGIALPFVNVMGFGVDLNTTVADLMRVASVSASVLGNLGPMISGLASSFSGQGMLRKMGIDSGSNLSVVTRGSGTAGASIAAGGSTSESGYVGNSNGGDVKNATIQDAEDSKKKEMIQAKEEAEENQVDVLNSYVLKIYTLLEEVVSGTSSIRVRTSGIGGSHTSNGTGSGDSFSNGNYGGTSTGSGAPGGGDGNGNWVLVMG